MRWIRICVSLAMLFLLFWLATRLHGIRPVAPAAAVEVSPTEDGRAVTEKRADGAPLVLRVVVEKTRIALAKDESVVYAELHNVGSKRAVVYMPGLVGRQSLSNLTPFVHVRPEYIPMLAGRFADTRNERNFVVLEPGDYYGREYRWRPYDRGNIQWTFSYENRDAGKAYDLDAWTGVLADVKAETVVVEWSTEALSQQLRLLKSSEVLDRETAAECLGYQGDMRALPALLERAQSDGDADVRMLSVFAIQHLSGQNLGLPAEEYRFDYSQHAPRVMEWAREFLRDHKGIQSDADLPERQPVTKL